MAITGIGGGILARLVQQLGAVKTQLGELAAQSADGRRADWYGELGGEAMRAISLRGEITRRDAHATAIQRALGTTGASQEALSRLSAVAQQYLGEVGKITNADTTRIAALAGAAREAVLEVAGLLNERHSGGYVFGGQDTSRPPIPDAANILATPMAADIRSAVAGLASGNVATVLAATRAAAASTAAGRTPFSAYALDTARGGGDPRPTVLTGDGEAVGTGLFADRNAVGPSSGSETGSWSRDLLRGLMSLASLKPEMVAAGTDFTALVNGIASSLKSAVTGLGEEAGALGLAEARLKSAQERHEAMTVTLRTQLTDVEEVDLATTLTALQETQTRLQASWQALAKLSSMSLTKFL